MVSLVAFNQFGRIKATGNTPLNTQILPLEKAHHYLPSNIGNVSGFISAFQLMAGALIGAPTSNNGSGVIVYTPPTAQNLLAAYAGNQFRVSAGDVMRVLVFNTGGTGIVINTGGVTGATGAFVAGTGAFNGTLAGAETDLHINWLQVSADGTTGVYQLF
jgi:hypothetical protein